MTPTFLPGHSLEFMATFTGDAFQHSGFGVTFGGAAVGDVQHQIGGTLWARTNSESRLAGDAISAAASSAHRIASASTGTLTQRGLPRGRRPGGLALDRSPGPMRPIAASDYNVFGGNIVIDWMRMDPFAPAGTFLSRVFDAESPVDWHTIAWTASSTTPESTISVRMGDTPTPDGTWTAFVPVALLARSAAARDTSNIA